MHAEQTQFDTLNIEYLADHFESDDAMCQDFGAWVGANFASPQAAMEV